MSLKAMQVKKLLEKYYGLEDIHLQYLEGFEDKTYKVACSAGQFIFKQYRANPQKIYTIEAENRVLVKLSSIKEFVFPQIQHTLDRDAYVLLDSEIYRLLSFVDGELLGAVSHSDEILQSLGVLLGRMNKELGDLSLPALSDRENEWDLRYLKKNLNLLPYIENVSDRNLVYYFFLQFDEVVYPVSNLLRRRLIHNDANDWNIVTGDNHVTGIFDFGDLANSWLINELAIGITYVMMEKENPLECAVHVINGYNRQIPLQELELDLLYYLIGARLCISLCQSAYGKVTKPDSAYVTISEKQAWSLIRKWISISPIAAQKAFREAVGLQFSPKHTAAELFKKRKTHFSESLTISYNSPISMSGAAFQYMYDREGNTFLDAYNNIMLAGHCHPKVVHAGQRMMARLNTNTRYLYPSILSYSEKLLARFPPSLNKVFFVNSGSEASDLAIRMARYYTSKEMILVLEHGYHGNTSAGFEMSHYKYASTGGTGKTSRIIEAPMPKVYGSGLPEDPASGKYYADITKERIKPYVNRIAAFIAEPIMGCGGQVPLADSYLKEIYPLIREQGGLCISDEVQVGFGRLGEWFWGFEMHGVVPDIVVLGKPMGNGHPIGAVITTDAIAAHFEGGPEFFSSFGGNPVSCAIGEAVLDVITEEDLQLNAHLVGNHLKLLLRNLQKKYPVIGDVRGQGMFLGVELVDPESEYPATELALEIKNRLREELVLISTDGPDDNVLKIKPPLSFNMKDAEILGRKLDSILNSI